MDACVFDEESSGQETPVGFRDSPGQWYTANHRKRAALLQLEGEPTQRDSQATQVATEALTEVATQSHHDLAPVFVAATPSQEEVLDEDEEETQIRMTNSEEQDGPPKLERKIFEEVVPLPIASAASETGRSFGNAGMGHSDDDADSDMSDDMLEQDGSVAGLSSIAASFQSREKEPEVVKKRIYKPRTPFRASPPLSTRDISDSSGGETEIEGEPKEESPAKTHPTTDKEKSLSKDGLALRLTKSASFSKAIAKEESSSLDVKSIRRSLSTPEKTQNSSSSKRDHGDSDDFSYAKAKRSRRSEDRNSSHRMELATSLEKQNAPETSNEDLQHDHSTTPQSGSDEVAHDTRRSPVSEVAVIGDGSTSPHSTPRSQRKALVSGRGRKRTASSRSATDNESANSQAKDRSIRIILTGLEPTPAIRKKIKSIAGAVYESNIEKATHVIAPQNQLKRTVKLLCGVSCCSHILGERWLDESARIGVAADEQANCLRNEEAEDKWQFDLRNTMYGVSAEQRQRLFADYSVFITNHKSVLPPVKDLVKIVECAGGKASSKGKPGSHDLVISSEAALATASVRKTLTQANAQRIYSAELVLSSILQQCVDLDKHRLEVPTIGKTWATKRRK
ncbi:Hypothetical protein PHPALM_3324 [Phytophthora palmivora]|uniref:BRCT domain-containing protein n=1 Tax=Phytophthora palmivora TaxID=4796 RepID=A0A2P4YMP4_9STRA|nr:Hypothetical protein PHPALM_3324 [Phytophthora palmivora]